MNILIGIIVLFIFLWFYADIFLYEYFKKNFQYGDYKRLDRCIFDDIAINTIDFCIFKELIDSFDRSIRTTIPSRHRKNIRFFIKLPWDSSDPSDIYGFVAWKYFPNRS